MDEDGHLAQVYVSEGVRPCRYRLQFAKDCFYSASSPTIPDITMLRSGHRICYTVEIISIAADITLFRTEARNLALSSALA